MFVCVYVCVCLCLCEFMGTIVIGCCLVCCKMMSQCLIVFFIYPARLYISMEHFVSVDQLIVNHLSLNLSLSLPSFYAYTYLRLSLSAFFFTLLSSSLYIYHRLLLSSLSGLQPNQSKLKLRLQLVGGTVLAMLYNEYDCKCSTVYILNDLYIIDSISDRFYSSKEFSFAFLADVFLFCFSYSSPTNYLLMCIPPFCFLFIPY